MSMYLMSYFRIDSEALHLAVSDDGCRWRTVRGGAPVFHSPVGTRTVRDPFICRTDDGRFHLLSTDGWTSRNIVHAVSDDLLNWQEVALVPVMETMPNTRNTWAPEAFRDEEAGCWRVVWSSGTAAVNSVVDGNHRIWGCTTTDFVHYTPPALFFDPGHSIIDACVVRDGNRYLMAFKDERGKHPPDHEEPGQRKAIAIATADRATGPWQNVAELVTPNLTEGPSLFRQAGKWVMAFDHFIEHRYGLLVSADGTHWEPDTRATEFPDGARHGSILEIPEEIGRRLPN